MTISVSPAEHALRAALAPIAAPGDARSLDAAGLIEALRVERDIVHLTLLVRPGEAQAMRAVAAAAEAALRAVQGVAETRVVLTSHRAAPSPAAAQSVAGSPAAGRAGSARPLLLPDVIHVVAVASGKGGVGKSTTAVNLAVALARTGWRVGLLDADVHGPSLPTMLGLERRPEVRGDRIQPVEAWGLRCMSIGFMVDTEAAMIWRGPMVMGAMEQLLGQVDWGTLDLMVIDMPPGTGDAHLTLSQRVALSGAVIVSTPQDVALMDARRGVRMFQKTNVPILGLIENMSGFACPHCGTISAIFGHGGARTEATRLDVPFLGAVPLLIDVRACADAGTPIVAAAPDGAAARAYTQIAASIRTALERLRPRGARALGS